MIISQMAELEGDHYVCVYMKINYQIAKMGIQNTQNKVLMKKEVYEASVRVF